MKRLGTYIQSLLALLMAPAMVVGCTERLSEEVIVSGRKANIEMTLSTETKLVNHSADRIINNLTLVVFNNQGERINIESIDYTNFPIRMNTVSGSNSRVLAIANAGKTLAQQINGATSYAQISQLVVSASDSLAKSGNLLMVGDSIINIKPGNNAITIPLRFVNSEISIKIEDQLTSGESFIINSCKLVNAPVSSYLFERPSDIDTKYVERYIDWDSDESTTNIEFFMFENRRGIRQTQEGEKEGEQHLNKRRYAPQGASYIVINATHRTERGTSSFDMYLYFGQNNATDYNVKRSEHHNYTIRVKGFNNISIDSNIEYTTNNFDVVYGDLRFDSHPDSRQLLLKNGNGNISVEVRDQNGRTFSDAGFNATWVKISPIDLMRHQIRQPGNGANSRWQQSGERGAFVRGKYIPHKSVRNTLSGGWNAVNVDYDDAMDYSSATYRMCYNINNIPISSATPNEIYIYTDDNTDGEERRAQIALSCTDNKGETKTQLITIHQQGAVYVGTFDDHQLYVEANEECGMNLYPDRLPFLSTHTTMQWGYNSKLLYNGADKLHNGAFMTASAVYGVGENAWASGDPRFVQKNSDGTPKFVNLVYRPKYASGLNGFSSVPEPYDDKKLNTSEAPYYYPAPQYWAVTFNPIYGSSAARYCHEKNRDKNGDGVIDDSETEWYLPSFNELEQIWVALNGINGEYRLGTDAKYWSSSEYSTDKAFAVDMASGAGYQAMSKASAARVRCVKRGQKSGSVVEVNAQGSVVVNNSDMPSGAVTNASKGAAPTTQSMNETIFKRFTVAKKDITNVAWSEAMDYSDKFNYNIAGNAKPDEPKNGCSSYSEAGNKSDLGHWRVPTSRELMRIYILAGKLSVASKDFAPLSASRYWSSSEDASWSAWCVDMAPQSTTQSEVQGAIDRGTKLTVRCVKELP